MYYQSYTSEPNSHTDSILLIWIKWQLICSSLQTNLDLHSYPFPKRQNSDSPKLKEFADDNFKFDDNRRKFSKSVENTRYKQFLLFSKCFQKICNADT